MPRAVFGVEPRLYAVCVAVGTFAKRCIYHKSATECRMSTNLSVGVFVCVRIPRAHNIYIYIYIIRTSYFGSCKHDSMRRAACACIFRGLYTHLFATVELCRVN